MSRRAAEGCYNYHIDLLVSQAGSQPSDSGEDAGPSRQNESFTLSSPEESDGPEGGASHSQEIEKHPKASGEYPVCTFSIPLKLRS